MAGGGGAAAPPPKQDELLPHPVKDQLSNVSYCITSPPPWRESPSFSLIEYFLDYLLCVCVATFLLVLVLHAIFCDIVQQVFLEAFACKNVSPHFLFIVIIVEIFMPLNFLSLARFSTILDQFFC